MPLKFIEQNIWVELSNNHDQRIRDLLGSYMERRGRHIKDPILDFLFEYYSFRPAMLARWSPGINVVLEGQSADSFLAYKGFNRVDGGVLVDPQLISHRRINAFRWIDELLHTVQERKPFLGCYGMHEWAMVYKTGKRRHPYIPLRVDNKTIDDFIESRPLICTHFDAYRFFTQPAKPINHHQLSQNQRLNFDQGGCIHVTMDLYKWAYKLYPWIRSELIADTFELAVEARTIDMQASPYDLKAFGLRPIKVETGEGRNLYRQKQQHLLEKARPLRYRLIKTYEQVLLQYDHRTVE